MKKKILSKSLRSLLFIIKSRIINKYFLKGKFKKIHGYKLDIDNPKTFNEKIQFRKKYGNKEFMALIADKYKVRKYIKEKIGEEYLIPLLEVYDSITLKDLEKLPNQFVIKSNNASGSDYIELVMNKSRIDLNKIVKKMNKAIKDKFWKVTGEKYYALIEPKIIVEKLLLNNGNLPEDYKFHCFKNGEKILVQFDRQRFDGHMQDFYDGNLKRIDLKINGENSKLEFIKPKKYEEMICIVKKIAEDFDYIRVDLYNINGKFFLVN